MESVEYGFALAFGDAWTGIVHSQAHASPVVVDAHPDTTTTTGEFASIVDEYACEPVNEGRLSLHEQRSAPHPFEGQLDPQRCRHRTKTPDTALNLPADVSQTRAVSEGHLVVRPGQPKQVLHNPPQPIALSADPLEHFPI